MERVTMGGLGYCYLHAIQLMFNPIKCDYNHFETTVIFYMDFKNPDFKNNRICFVPTFYIK